jgi:nucleoside-diphosphate-sugar epimerase
MENILVTGGAGFIGSHTCKALRRAGYNPITFDNLVGSEVGSARAGRFCRAMATSAVC